MVRRIATRLGLLALIALMLGGLTACDKSSSAGLVDLVGAAASTSTIAADTSATGPPATAPPPSSCRLVDGTYPDPICSPGATNPRVTQANIGETICVSGWSTAERKQYFPSSSTMKERVLAAYGLPISARGGYELDHRVPIEVGGDPASPAQFFPEPWDGPHGAKAKDNLEDEAHRKVCSGVWTLAYAQGLFLGTNW